jgi:predicted MFS family arabinose efflux permease
VGIASILAILASGQITLSSWRGNVWLAGALGVVLLFWTSIILKNVSTASAPRFSFRQIFSQMKKVFAHPAFLGSAFSHSMTYGLMYGYIALFPFLMMELFHEKNPTQVGIYSAYMIGCYMTGAFLASRFVKRWPAEKFVFVGISLQIVAEDGLFLHLHRFSLWGLSLFSIWESESSCPSQQPVHLPPLLARWLELPLQALEFLIG